MNKASHYDAVHVGMLFQVFGRMATDEDWDMAKEEVPKYTRGLNIPGNAEPYITITLACGEKYVIQTIEDLMRLPIKDVPCTCGNPNHWFIRFSNKEVI